MRVVVLHGTARQGTTWRLTRLLLEQLPQAQVREFAFPRDMNGVCVGCLGCILGSESVCPHAVQVEPIRAALREADLIVAATPVYVMGMTAGLKAFFEHMAYAWLVHRPDPCMGGKVAVAVATAAGPCTGKTLRDIRQQFFHWGIPRTYAWGEAVGGGWDYLSAEQKAALKRRAVRLARRVTARVGHTKPTVKLRVVARLMSALRRRTEAEIDPE